MVETKYRQDHHAGATPQERINNRLRNSGSPKADTVVQKDQGPTRTFHNIHNAGSAKEHRNPAIGSNKPLEAMAINYADRDDGYILIRGAWATDGFLKAAHRSCQSRIFICRTCAATHALNLTEGADGQILRQAG